MSTVSVIGFIIPACSILFSSSLNFGIMAGGTRLAAGLYLGNSPSFIVKEYLYPVFNFPKPLKTSNSENELYTRPVQPVALSSK